MIKFSPRWMVVAISILSISAGINAAVLSPDAALFRVGADSSPTVKMMSVNKPKLAHTFMSTASSQATIYAFDRPYGGYMLVSAESSTVPLLGYTDSGVFDPDNIPANMKAWLQGYSDQIDYMRSTGKELTYKAPQRPARNEIAPLVKTLWNQSAPYNNLCPIDPKTNKPVVTGCVATAMAQVMNYHRWPDKGVGYNAYAWNNVSVSFDFENTTFDWDNMLNTYDETATEVQETAVATLMSACGVSVNMDYSSSGSGAVGLNVYKALNKYFKYNSYLANAQRDYYNSMDWEDIVYEQLAKVGPVLYCGTSTGGGHEFVCDGYSTDGYFHINWGWGGKSDGYFLLSTLNPYEQGIGGGSNSGFVFNQSIVCGMTPEYLPGQKYSSWILSNEPVINNADKEYAAGDNLTYKYTLKNNACYTQSGDVGMAIYDSQGQAVAQGLVNVINVAVDGTKIVNGSLSIPAEMADGVYTVAPAYIDYDGVIKKIPVKQTYHPCYTMIVASGKAALTQDSPTANETVPTVENLKVEGRAIVGQPIKVTFTLYNEGDGEFSNFIYAGITEKDGSSIYSVSDQDELVEIPGKAKVDFEIEVPYNSLLAPGEWEVRVYSRSRLLPTFGYMKVGDPVGFNIYYPDPTEVTLPQSIKAGVGRSVQLTPITAPDPSNREFTWSSDNPSVATVDADGLVKGIAPGTAAVKVVTSNNLEATCNIEVLPCVDIDDKEVTLNVGETYKLKTTVNPTGATVPSITWTSDKTAVATVSADGIVTAQSAGKAVITANANGITSSVTVTVTTSVTRDFPATVENIIYDYTDETHTALKVTGNTVSVTSYVKILDNIDGIPVTTIGANAVSGFSSVKGVIIPEGVTTAEASAINSTSTYTLYLPKSLVNIADGAFKTSGVRKLFIAPGCDVDYTGKVSTSSSAVVYVDKMPAKAAFPAGRYKVYSQLSEMFVKDNVVYIPTGVDECEAVDYQFPATASDIVIPSVAVSGLKAYKPVALGNFFAYFAPKVGKVEIPATIKTIGTSALAYMTVTTDAICHATVPADITLGSTPFSSTATNCTLHVPAGTKSLYEAAEQWNTFKSIVELDPMQPGINLSETTMKLKPGESRLLIASGYPEENFTEPFTMVSDNSSVATVDKAGVINAVANGTANITVSSSGYTATCVVKVSDLVVRDFPCTVDGINYDYTDASETALMVLGAENIQYAVTIPEHIDGVPVTTIAENAFTSKTPRSLTLPSTITTIKEKALAGTLLYYVNIPAGVTELASNAFNTTSLRRLVWENELEPRLANYGFTSTAAVAVFLAKAPADITDSRFVILPALADRFKRNGITYVPTDNNTCIAINYESLLTTGCEISIPDIVNDGEKDLTVNAIGDLFQRGDTRATSVELPATITSIGRMAFYGCSKIESFTAKMPTPADVTLGTQVFTSIPFAKCTLSVPHGSGALYAQADQWKDFTNIEEEEPVTPVITLSHKNAKLLVGNTLKLSYTVAPEGSLTESVTWQSTTPAVATVDNEGVVTAVAPGSTKIIVSAGDVADTCELTVIKGSDREFPVTIDGVIYDYNDDTHLSLAAIGYDSKSTEYATVKIKDAIDDIPVTAVGKNAFARGKMRGIMLGKNVEVVGDSAFYYCYAASIYLPKSLKELGPNTFYLTSTYLRKVFNEAPASLDLSAAYLKSYNDFVLYVPEMPTGSDKKYIDAKYAVCPRLSERFEVDGVVYAPISDTECAAIDVIYDKNTAIKINQVVSDGNHSYTVKELGMYLGFNHYYVKEVSIPSAVNNIGIRAFASASKIDNVTVYASNPNDITMGANVFDKVKFENATLNVPYGTSELYAKAPQWMDFTNIKEMKSDDPVSGIEGVTNDNDGYIMTGNTIIVQPGVNIAVYDLGGKLIFGGEGCRYTLPRPGVYIVNIGGHVHKVMAR